MYEAAEVAVAAVAAALDSASQVMHARFVLFDGATLKAYVRAFEKLHKSGSLSPTNVERNTP